MSPVNENATIPSAAKHERGLWGKDRAVASPPKGESGVQAKRELKSILATFLTTLACFGVFFVQGVIVARILGPIGRGEFGSAIYFPRDILLYAGLLGGIEIVNSYAKNLRGNEVALKYSAVRLGLISGTITAFTAAILAVVIFTLIPDKSYLIPLCLFCCLFLPFEHIQLIVSAVDRGTESYAAYNWNRFAFAIAFPVLLLSVFGLDEVLRQSNVFYSGFNEALGLSPLPLVCAIFVLSRILGLLPTLRGMGIRKRLVDLLSSPGTSPGAKVVPEGPTAKNLLVEGRPFALSMIATELFERLDIFLILALGAMNEAGFYFVAVPAAALLTVAPNALGVFTFNAGADVNRVVSLKQGLSVMAGIVGLQIVSTFVFTVIIPYLIVWVFSDEFAGAIPFAMWLLPACAIKGYLQAVDGYLKGCGKPLIGVWARFLSIFLMLIFVWLTYSRVGLLSIPMAACLGQAVSMVIISIAVVRHLIERNRQKALAGGSAS